jgi:holo-[acyl-carrier protein] synthase
MLPISVGIDIVYIPRFTKLLQDESFKRRLFSATELEFPPHSLAGNFAVKESFAKAFSEPIHQLELSKLEVLRDDSGAPQFRSQSAKFNRLIQRVISVSMSHEIDYCVGLVLALKGEHYASLS